jgi:hypothetical protein
LASNFRDLACQPLEALLIYTPSKQAADNSSLLRKKDDVILKIQRWFFPVFLAFLLLGKENSLQAQTLSFEIMSGDAYNIPTVLTVRQTGYPNIQFLADYDTEPLGPYAPYYSWRACLWNKNKDECWEIQQVHHRLFLTNNPPQIQYFAIHFGYNYFFLGHAWKKDDFIYHLDAGVLITNPENTVRGQVLNNQDAGIFDAGYNFSGVGAEMAVSRNLNFTKNVYAVLDLAFIAGWATVPVSNGSADVPNLAIHGHLGMGFSI